MASAIVLPFWKMKHNERRWHEFLSWNEMVFCARDLVVIAICHKDEIYDSCGRIHVIPHPDNMPFFSLSKTCNYGIRLAMLAGLSPIVKTDVDIMFPGDALDELLSVANGTAVCQPYHMVDSVSARHKMTDNRLIADLAMGTIAMTAEDWNKTNGYDERLEGYGCDDGDMWHRIGTAGIKRFRGIGAYHIAHVSGSIQQEAHVGGDKSHGTRSDHHNRGTVNPNRLRQNSRIVRGSTWKSDRWGIPNAGISDNPLQAAR